MIPTTYYLTFLPEFEKVNRKLPNEIVKRILKLYVQQGNIYPVEISV